jgi:hypothetical protein
VEDNPLKAAWQNLYGDNAIVLLPNETKFILNVESIYNRKAVIVNDLILQTCLESAGVEFLADVVGDELDFDFIEFQDGPKASMLEKAIKIVNSYDDRISTCVENLKVFMPTTSQSNLLGVARNKSIYLSSNAFNDIEVLIGTLIHELDHVVTGYSDDDRGFRDAADKRIASLVMKLYS